jgi:hypothetical protein
MHLSFPTEIRIPQKLFDFREIGFHRVCAWLYEQVRKITEYFISRNFFCGFQKISPQEELTKRMDVLYARGAYPIDCISSEGKKIDAIRIPSPSCSKDTDNIILFALIHHYQRHPPKHYDHYLKDGADVVLWNPTGLTPKQYAEDLQKILEKLLQENPNQKITIDTYCGSADPAISAAAALNQPNISLIIDRGYGEPYKLVRSLGLFAAIPIVRDIIENKFNCDGINKIAQIPGKILFIAPQEKEDQLMTCGNENLTRNLHKKRQGRPGDRLIELQNSDHWSPWNSTVHRDVKEFLKQEGIISSHYTADETLFPEPSPPSFYMRSIFPLLLKPPC